ncbi:MAG TPA: hypothetical protein ENK06_11825, partial [Gammaproteobacteria bacterium]|nr:hypothetical protein [Gammaproteobacteria bacterium]
MSVLSKKIVVSLFSLFAVILTVAFVFSGVGVENNALSLIIDKTFLEKNQIQMIGSPLRSWESADYQDGGLNSLTVVNYNKCIPVQQCTFEDCDVEGSRDGKGHFCLPVSFSKIGDWAPDISIKVFGISLLENPAVYAAPVEHTQAAARLPDLNNNAYFMFSNSQNHYGFIWVVEVKGIDPNNPQRITSSMPANVVWWQKLNKCHSLAQCNDQYNPGNFNHPARISVVDSMAAIAFQNYSYTVQGKFSLAKVSNFFNNDKILIPKILETSTLPKYPRVRSADAVGFYDVSNPRRPKFIRKLIGDLPELWGGYPPGRDISEVAITKAGDYYHLNVGGTIYNYNGEGKDKTFAKNYRVTFPYSTKSIVPMFGDVSGNIFANIVYSNAAYPAGISLNSVPIFAETSEHIDYALTLQLIETQIAYNSGSKHRIDDSTNNT